jgi:large subunit ribosomal protein L9
MILSHHVEGERTMEVILLERVAKLGQMGDVVRVKDGFARNYLLAQGKALRATEANREKFERDRDQLEARNAERRTLAGGEAGKVDRKSFVVLRQAGESGQLYGSVSTRDIAGMIAKESGTQIGRGQVVLEKPIKTIGLHSITIQLHPEVAVAVTLNVARSADEAEAQARGEVLVGSPEEREAAQLRAAEMFEDEDLARETETGSAEQPEGGPAAG